MVFLGVITIAIIVPHLYWFPLWDLGGFLIGVTKGGWDTFKTYNKTLILLENNHEDLIPDYNFYCDKMGVKMAINDFNKYKIK